MLVLLWDTFFLVCVSRIVLTIKLDPLSCAAFVTLNEIWFKSVCSCRRPVPNNICWHFGRILDFFWTPWSFDKRSHNVWVLKDYCLWDGDARLSTLQSFVEIQGGAWPLQLQCYGLLWLLLLWILDPPQIMNSCILSFDKKCFVYHLWFWLIFGALTGISSVSQCMHVHLVEDWSNCRSCILSGRYPSPPRLTVTRTSFWWSYHIWAFYCTW